MIKNTKKVTCYVYSIVFLNILYLNVYCVNTKNNAINLSSIREYCINFLNK